MTEAKGGRSTGTHPPLRVLFVCTANISRSAYAERRARQVLPGGTDPDFTFASAGTPGYPDRGMDPAMQSLLAARGADPSGHISRGVGEELMRRADLVVTFEFAQHMRLLDEFPEHRRVIVGLQQAARAVRSLEEADAVGRAGLDVVDRVERLIAAAGPNSMSLDVEDPYNRGPRAARACADEIDGLLDVLLPYLAGRTLPKLAVPPVEPERRRPGWPWRRAPRRALP